VNRLGRRWKLIAAAVTVAVATTAAAFVGVVRAAPPGAPTNSGPPIILGTFQSGQTLSVLVGAWSGSPFSYSYQWQNCNPVGGACTNISVATAPTYEVQASDVADLLRVVVTATNSSGSSDPANSSTVGPVVAAGAPANTSPPTITGPAPPQQGQALQAQPGTWVNAASIAYQWLRCDTNGVNCVAIQNATQQSYTPVAADSGSRLRVLANATSTGPPAGGGRNVSAATQTVTGAGPQNTAKPAISGTVVVGQTLTASNGTWTSPNGSPITYTYQWQRCNAQGQSCQPIQGAVQQSYTLQQADVGSTLVVTVTATNNQGSQAATSNATGVVQGSPSGTTIPVSQVSLPNQLVITAYQFQPSVLSSRAPFTARFRVSDTQGHFVSGAQVNLVIVPYGRVARAPVLTTDQDGWATFTLQPTSKFPLIKGYLITMQARAVKPGDNILEGVTAWRLVSVRINPGA
jgi:hypothetical protein